MLRGSPVYFVRLVYWVYFVRRQGIGETGIRGERVQWYEIETQGGLRTLILSVQERCGCAVYFIRFAQNAEVSVIALQHQHFRLQ